jgi:hypothetical protein
MDYNEVDDRKQAVLTSGQKSFCRRFSTKSLQRGKKRREKTYKFFNNKEKLLDKNCITVSAR